MASPVKKSLELTEAWRVMGSEFVLHFVVTYNGAHKNAMIFRNIKFMNIHETIGANPIKGGRHLKPPKFEHIFEMS